jgi:hypothetical protein
MRAMIQRDFHANCAHIQSAVHKREERANLSEKARQ